MVKKVIVHTMLLLLALFCILPFCMVVAVSFSAEKDVAMFGYSLIPHTFSTEAYQYLFQQSGQLLRSYGVTIFVSLVGTLGGKCAMAGLAYPLSRSNFIFKRYLSLFLFVAMVFNGGLAPTYIWISNYLHLRDTVAVLILPLLVNVWNVFLLRTYFAAVPDSLIEAAVLDGAGELRILLQIMLPVSKVGIATVSLFTLLIYWNDWFTSMIYIDSNRWVSLQYLLYRIMDNISFFKNSSQSVQAMLGGQDLPSETFRMAIAVVAAGPMVFIFTFFQKYFVKGVMVGSVKG